MKKVIVYGLGRRFDANKERLRRVFDIIGYSDQNKEMATKLNQNEVFIPLDCFMSYDFSKIIICGGGMEAKNYIFMKYMDDISREDIIFLEDLDKKRISRTKFLADMDRYKATNLHPNFAVKDEEIYPIADDIGEDADTLDGHYFMQDICVARKILEDNPKKHYDIGSRIDGFIAHLLVFRKNITLIDVRTFPHKIDGLSFVQADGKSLNGIQDNSIESLSCLHAAEHFGLGRYGDDVDAEAFFIAMRNFERVLSWGGQIISVCSM